MARALSVTRTVSPENRDVGRGWGWAREAVDSGNIGPPEWQEATWAVIGRRQTRRSRLTTRMPLQRALMALNELMGSESFLGQQVHGSHCAVHGKSRANADKGRPRWLLIIAEI